MCVLLIAACLGHPLKDLKSWQEPRNDLHTMAELGEFLHLFMQVEKQPHLIVISDSLYSTDFVVLYMHSRKEFFPTDYLTQGLWLVNSLLRQRDKMLAILRPFRCLWLMWLSFNAAQNRPAQICPDSSRRLR